MKINKLITVMSLSLIVLLFSAFNAFDYEKAWKNVENFMEKGLPKSALKEVDQIYAMALKDKNTNQLVKATIFKTGLILNTEELGLETVVKELEDNIALAESPAKEILHSMAAELFHQYFQSQYYLISQRTNLIEYNIEDIRTWTTINFRDYIANHYFASLSNQLTSYKTEDYKDLVENFENADLTLRPSLYELLLDRSLQYFSSSELGGVKPSFAFKIDNEVYFAPAKAFASLNITTQDTLSQQYQALLLFQKGIQTQLNANNEKVLADYDLNRLQFVMRNQEMKDSKSFYEKAIDHAASFYTGQNKHAFQLIQASQLLGEEQYNDALNLYNKILSDNPNDYIKGQALQQIDNINRKNLSVHSEQVVPKNKAFLINVQSRNLDQVCFKLLDASKADFTKIFNGKREDQQAKIDRLPELKRWSQKDIREGYKPSSFEVIMDGLPYGKYILLASDTEDAKAQTSAYVFTAFFVSDIAYSTYQLKEGTKIIVRDRSTGQPISKVKVEVYSQEYNRQNRSYELKFEKSSVTDRDGMTLLSLKEGSSYVYKLINKEDVLDLRQFDGHYRIHEREYRSQMTEIFLDRAIYRPGQTVHFKTLAMKVDQNGLPSIDPNGKLAVQLLDANGQKVEEMDIVSNDFGSANGSFILPTGRLTGQFSLHVINGSGNTSTYFSVEEYKRPKFEVTLDDVDSGIKLGDNIKVKGTATALSGSPVSNGKVSYVINRVTYYGWWSWYRQIPSENIQIAVGEIEADAQGSFDFEFIAEADKDLDASKNPTYSYEVQVDVTDLAGETRSSSKQISISVLPYAFVWDINEVMDVSELKGVSIKASTSSNQNVSSKATLIISELEQPEVWKKPRLWGNPSTQVKDKSEFEKRIERIGYETSVLSTYPIKKEIFRGDLQITENGILHDFTKIFEAGKSYKIELVSKEKYRDVAVQQTDYLAVSDFDKGKFPLLHLMYSNGQKQNAKVGEKFELDLGTSDKKLKVFYQIVRDSKVLEEGFADLDSKHRICYEPVELDRGGFTILVDFVKHNYSEKKRFDIQLPWDNKKLTVELVTKRDKVLPGSKEEWTLKVSGPNKDKFVAEMLATMYDASLDQFIPHSYNFNPYLSHFGNIQSNFYGFGNGLSNSLNYEWNRIQRDRINMPNIPMLIGIHSAQFRGLYNGGGISVRGSRSRNTEYYNDGVRVMDAAPASAEMVLQEEGESLDSDSYNKKGDFAPNSNNASGAIDTENADKKPEISIRKNLNESVFFYPNLKTDAEGNVIISFTMNEALTRWKLLTFTHDKDLRFGMVAHEVKTQKDLMITANPSRFLREGDQMYFPATVTNLSEKDIQVTAQLELINPDNDRSINDAFQLKDASKNLTIQKGESARVDWSIHIPKNYKGLVQYRVIASSGEHTDGEESILPVVTNQVLVTETKVISLKKQEKKTFEFDALKRTESSTSSPFAYTLEYTSNPVWYAVQALPYLMEYPHQCTEQIFNRMYANTMASYIANQNPKIKSVFEQWKALDSDALISNLEKNESLKSAILEETPWVRQAQSETEQKKRIALLFDLNKMSSETKSVLAELNDRQMPSGAFPWFTGGREDVFITQNVVEGIVHLEYLGIISSNDYDYFNLVDRALVYLDDELAKRYERLLENIQRYGGKMEDDHLDQLSIHYLYIRSFLKDKQVSSKAQKAYEYYQSQAEKYWLKKGLYSEAMLGLTFKRGGNQTYKEVLKSHKERSFFSEELGRYWNSGNGFNWYELPIETHAMMIEFFSEAEVDTDFVEDMKIWLLKNKQTNHWKTTKGTAAAIYALLIQGEKGMTKWIAESNQPIITIGNKVLALENEKVEVGTGYFQKTWNAREITPEMQSITIDNKNETIAWGAAYYQYFEDLDKVKDFRETPLKMKRTLYKEVTSDRGAVLEPLNENSTIKPGDRLIARIELVVDRSMSYVHLKDMRGAGFEPENVLSGYRWKGGLGYYESTRDLASHFFIDHLSKGTYVFEYPLRAVHKGNFSTGIATLQCMYAPEFTSHSEGGRIVVK